MEIEPTDTLQALVEMNLTWLRQALALLQRITSTQFSEPPTDLAPHRVSSQLRHIVEFYECFLSGIEPAEVNYDGRARDERFEASPAEARSRIELIANRLGALRAVRAETILMVHMEDAAARGTGDSLLLSSVGRELMALSSHTIHHFALVAITLRAHGVAVDPDFGVAPSTLTHRASQSTLLTRAA